MEDSSRNKPEDREEFSRQIPAYLSGDLEGSGLLAFEERLAADGSLRAEVEGLRALWERLPDSAPDSAPLDFWPIVRASLREARTAPFPSPQPAWRIAVSFAAGIIVGLAFWLLATGGPAESTAATEELLAQDVIFETLDPIPSESVAGIYFAMLPVEEER